MGTFTETALPEWTDREVREDHFSPSAVFDLSKRDRRRVNELLKECSGEEDIAPIRDIYKK